MNDEITADKSWWKRNWKWSTPLIAILLILIMVFFSSGFCEILADYSKSYANLKLYENALEKAKQNERVKEVLGPIEPIDNMAILNGSVSYSDDNTSVNSTIKITGDKGKAMLDISADRNNEAWIYKKITIRIKNPPENKETIEILKTVK